MAEDPQQQQPPGQKVAAGNNAVAGTPPPAPRSPGCFHLGLVERSLAFYYDPNGGGQITPEHLELMGQIARAEAVIKELFYPDGLPDDLKLRAPSLGVHHGKSKAEEPASSTAQPAEPGTAPEPPAIQQQTSVKPKDSDVGAKAKLESQARKVEKKEQTFKSYFYALYLLAQIGLDGPNAQPWMASTELADFKSKVEVLEGGRVKNRYMRSLAICALAMGLPVLALLAIYEAAYVLRAPALLTKDWLLVVKVLFFAWSGAMVGTWVSFAIRNPSLTFEQLAVPEEDRLKPAMRLAYVGLLAILFVSGLVLGLFTVVIGSFDTRHILNHGGYAFLIGALCGISEKVIGQRLQREAGQLSK